MSKNQKLRFTKKPVTIEATQWFKHGDHATVTSIPASHPIDRNCIDPSVFGWVPTLEGGHVVTPGDWIITGVKGEHYPCKPDIFSATYVPADEQALALPTAAPVGEHELPPLPVTSYQLYYQWSDDEDGCGGSEVVDGDAYTADQMRAYARAALSDCDAVDAQRYRWLREQSDDDFVFAVVKNPHFDVYESPEELDAAIDASMRKGQL